MTILKINNRTLEINFDYAQQGHRVTVMEYLGGQWEILADWNYVLCLGATYFDTLCNIASALFEEAAIGETLAQLMGIEMRSSDDAECAKCGCFHHYESEEIESGYTLEATDLEALGMFDWEHVCVDCLETYKSGSVVV